ncbi:PAS domain-containing protein [Stigmatella aurantiaca]|uniref:Photoactive yellow protein n=1 Tax=Stigmatella aurantiaca (strain DW4/3-1) TaxID=378806 RepID=Q098L8_STIAD|nr:PAS domain-containing protein [Stigmatella aurantiaca]ADO74171.1 Photoactive yellow protein [Stigmatella aurantiaca DW4/3-1]EAU68200.1 photoactive yellow protein [Stigmatella aurantiaca DW4/3-1]
MRHGILEAESLTEDRLGQLSPEEFDALPFGAIKLDAEGRVLIYNAAESAFSRRKPVSVLGRRFFEEVAPCTNVASFRGRFDTLVERGHGTESFDFQFRFRWGTRNVRIRLMVLGDGSRWVFVTAVLTALIPLGEG